MTTQELIQSQIDANPILLYMKGHPQAPQCGFSAQVVSILNKLQVEFVSVDILQHPDIRATLPKYANWPTFPQLFVQGELIGGCDIVTQMFEEGELAELVKINS